MKALRPFAVAVLAFGSTACGGRAAVSDVSLEPERNEPARPGRTISPGAPSQGSGAAGSAAANGGGQNMPATSAGGAVGVGGNPAVGGAPAQPPDGEPPVVLADGCESLLRLDPKEVYLIGTLEEGACGRGALAHWSEPNTALVGFGCANDPTAAIIRPLAGSLVLDDSFGPLREFHPDGCFRGSARTYPPEPAANDPPVVFPCVNPSSTARIVIAPRGDEAFECTEGTWHAADGSVLFSGDAFGNGIVMAYDGDRFLTIGGVFDIAAQTLHPFDGPPRFLLDRDVSRPIASRVNGSGFWIVMGVYEGFERAELWQIDTIGQGTHIGTYPEPPPRASFVSPATLSADGTLYQFAKDETATDNDLIIRRGVGGVSEIIYEEAFNPLVRVHISGLITGP